MSENHVHIRLGDLLMKAGILTSDYISQALAKYEDQGLPLGKVLVSSGYLTDQELRNALTLQYMVNDRLLTFDDAVQVLQSSQGKSLPLDQAFQASGLVQPEEKETNKLGQILLDSKVIDEKQLEQCLESCSTTGLPLGHILCHRGLASQPLINRALITQQYIRRGQLLRHQGIDSLRIAGEREQSLEALQINRGYKKQTLKNTPMFGELLVAARIATERQMTEALLNSVASNQPIGQTMVSMRHLTEDFVYNAVVIQEMIDNDIIDVDRAREALIEVRVKGYSAVRAVSETCVLGMKSNPSRALITLLTSTGLLSVHKIPADVQERLDVTYNQVSYVCKALLSQSLVDENMIQDAMYCVYLIDRKAIANDKAIVALEFASKAKVDVAYALYMLGMTERTRLNEREQVLAG